MVARYVVEHFNHLGIVAEVCREIGVVRVCAGVEAQEEMQMGGKAVQLVSIHDHAAERNFLGFDLSDVLDSLGERMWAWEWCITYLDAFGFAVEDLCQKVEASRPKGVWLSSDDIIQVASRIQRTIDGTFLAFPKGDDYSAMPSAEVSLQFFAASRAQLAIQAVDSTYFLVYAKSPLDLQRIRRRFRDVRREDAIQ